jgi:hypothetical protein
MTIVYYSKSFLFIFNHVNINLEFACFLKVEYYSKDLLVVEFMYLFLFNLRSYYFFLDSNLNEKLYLIN